MKKRFLNIAMVIIMLIIVGLLLLSWFFLPVYTVQTEGDLTVGGSSTEFEVTEEYYLDHYQASSTTHEMFDTDDDGQPDSKQSPEYKYSDKADLKDSETGNNYGWAGSIEEGGQPAKAGIYRNSFYTMIAGLVFSVLVMIFVSLGGKKVPLLALANILGFCLIISCIVFPLMLGIGLSGAYLEDDKAYYEQEQAAGSLKYEPTDVGDAFIGEIRSQSAGGKDFYYYTDPDYEIPAGQDTQASHYLDEDPNGRQWSPYFGAQSAAGYSYDQTGSTPTGDDDPNATAPTVVKITKVTYGPGAGWFLSILTIFIAIFAWIFSIVITVVTTLAARKERMDNDEDEAIVTSSVEVVGSEETEDDDAQGNSVRYISQEEKVSIVCPGCECYFSINKNSKSIKCPSCGLKGEL